MSAKKIIGLFSTAVFFLMGITFMVVALVIIGVSAWKLFELPCEKCDLLQELLSFVGFLIIAVAIFDVGLYLLEEQALKERKLRTPGEIRQSLTKFMVIIVIAVSLESLINVLKASTSDMRLLTYPSILLFVAVLLMVGLGLYQRFSNLAEKEKL